MMARRIRDYIEQVLTCEQRAVCDQEGSFVVIACPGSGKTRTAGTRFGWRIANYTSRRVGVAAISFTNVACEEIVDHLSGLGFRGVPQWPHFLGTIDSFVNQFVFLPFGHLAMGCSRRPDVVHPQSTLYPWVESAMRTKALAGCYSKGCGSTLFGFAVDGTLVWRGGTRKRQPSCDRDQCGAVKGVMVRGAFALPSDAMYWAMCVLRDYPAICRAIARRFPEIIVDEAQDTSETQVAIIRALAAAGCDIALVGDPDQSIYDFNGARPDLFESFAKEWPPLRLTTSFRSSQLICNAVCRFASGDRDPMTATGEHKECPLTPVVVKYPLGAEVDLLPRFRAILEEREITPDNAAVLAWTHDLVSKMRGKDNDDWPRGLTPVAKALARAAAYRDQLPPLRAEAHRDVMWALLRICFGVGHYGLGYKAIAPVGIREWRRIGWSAHSGESDHAFRSKVTARSG